MFIWQAGGETVAEDLASCPIDTPEAIAGAQFYTDIIYNPEYAAPEDVITEQGFGEMVKAGKVALFFGGAGDDLDYAAKKDPVNAVLKMAVVPKGPQSARPSPGPPRPWSTPSRRTPTSPTRHSSP